MSRSVFPLLFCCLFVFSVPDRYKQKHNSKKAEEGIWTCRHLVFSVSSGVQSENDCLNASLLQRSDALNAPEVESVALHDFSAPLCLPACFLHGMEKKNQNNASAAASAGGCMLLTPSPALASPPCCSRCRSGSEEAVLSFGSVGSDGWVPVFYDGYSCVLLHPSCKIRL